MFVQYISHDAINPDVSHRVLERALFEQSTRYLTGVATDDGNEHILSETNLKFLSVKCPKRATSGSPDSRNSRHKGLNLRPCVRRQIIKIGPGLPIYADRLRFAFLVFKWVLVAD